jgi:hypothetical protein
MRHFVRWFNWPLPKIGDAGRENLSVLFATDQWLSLCATSSRCDFCLDPQPDMYLQCAKAAFFSSEPGAEECPAKRSID